MRNVYPPRAIVIAASTGGPQALRELCAGMSAYNFTAPVYVVLHLPDGFAGIIASQLAAASGMPAHESIDGAIAEQGHIYIASSGKHLTLLRDGVNVRLRHTRSELVNYCRPSADVLFPSAAAIYGHDLLAVVLSGMGQDGLAGSQAVAQADGEIIVQDKESSAVWGMPGAVHKAGLTKIALPPAGLAHYLKLRFGKSDRSVA